MRIYIPSYLGDVRLEREGDTTVLKYEALTSLEEQAINKFLKFYNLKLGGDKLGTITLPEKLEAAHKRFIKAFKMGKPVLNAIKTKDGKMEIVQDFTVLRQGVGVTTEKPPRGCPVPTYESKEIRGQAVLQEFLTPQQWADFEKHRAFISRGNHTGRPYLLTSRWNPICEVMGVLYSLVTQSRICASLVTVPPSEELLAMKISVECDELNFVGDDA